LLYKPRATGSEPPFPAQSPFIALHIVDGGNANAAHKSRINKNLIAAEMNGGIDSTNILKFNFQRFAGGRRSKPFIQIVALMQGGNFHVRVQQVIRENGDHLFIAVHQKSHFRLAGLFMPGQ
jgi:hypothetical protein